MNRNEFKASPEAQKKFYIFVGVIALALLWLWFGGSDRPAQRPVPPVWAAPAGRR